MYTEVIKTSYKIYITVTNQWGGTEKTTVIDLESGKKKVYKSILDVPEQVLKDIAVARYVYGSVDHSGR